MAVRAVIVGCGAMSRGWLEAAAMIDGLSIVGLVDIDVARARSRADEFGLEGAVTGTNLEAVLSGTKPDVVFDVVVPSARHDVAMTAFAHGCHVLSEKPMADTLDHAKALVRAAKKCGLVHAIIQNRRYLGGIRRIRRFFDSGAVGRMTSLHCDFFLGPHFGGFREEMRHVLLLEMAIHTFDAARYIANARPTGVYCREWNPSNSWYAHGSSAAAIFDFDDGRVFTYRGSWCAEGMNTSWESAWRFIGERGTLVWDGFDTFSAARVAEAGGFSSEVVGVEVPALHPADRVDGHLGVMRDFLDAIANGSEPETASRTNIESLAMVFGAIESAQTHRQVAISLDSI